MYKRVLIIVAILISAIFSYWLWTNEFHTNSYLVHLRPILRKSWFPLTAIPISLLISVSFILTVSLFNKSNKLLNYILCTLIVFLFIVGSFYVFKPLLLWSLRGFKFPELTYFIATIFIIPLLGFGISRVINYFLIKTQLKFIMWFWLGVILPIPLSLICLYFIDKYSLSNNWPVLTAVQKGYPIFWLNLTIPLTTFIYYKKQSSFNISADT